MSDVTLELDGHVAVVEMHRPPANFFDRVLLQEVADAAEQAQSSGARAIVLCSEGKHFCAGASLSDGSGQVSPRETAAAVYAQARRVFALEIPIVAAVQGAAVGGGLGLACAADFRVASSGSRSPMPPNIGCPCAVWVTMPVSLVASGNMMTGPGWSRT